MTAADIQFVAGKLCVSVKTDCPSTKRAVLFVVVFSVFVVLLQLCVVVCDSLGFACFSVLLFCFSL